MVYISQNVLRSRDSRLFVHQFDDSDIDEILSALLDNDTPHLGISLQFSAEGHVEAVALATTNEAFYISLQGSARGENAPTANKRVLKGPGKTGPASTMSTKTPHITTLITTRLNKVLAGFSMAKIALHLHRDQGWNVSGIDLSTLLVSTGERPLYPSDFLDKISEPSPNKRQINTQWYPDNYDDEGDYEYENMCKVSLHAWISAV